MRQFSDTLHGALSARGLAIIGLTTSILLASCTQAATTTDAQRSAVLANGSMTATVSATGNIQAESEVKLTFQQVGTAGEVKVKIGDSVKKGDLLAKLDTTDLELAMGQAKAAIAQAEIAGASAHAQVIIATAAYSRTVDPSRATDIAAANATLNAALENYNKAKTGPTAEDIAGVQAALANAEASLKQAQGAYDRAYGQNPAAIGASPAALALEQATNAYNLAKANFDKVAKGTDAAGMASALQQVQAARAQLDKTKQPARTFDIEQAKAQITQAELSVKNADTQKQLAELQLKQSQRRLDLAQINAPMDGVISAVNVKVGESVGAVPVINMVDLSQYHIDITVDEIDVSKVKLGQDVVVTLDSLPGVEVKGTIDRINPTSTTINGVVSYSVRVLIGKTDAPLRTGMTANASIVLEKRDAVLLAPNWAVRRDKTTGKAYLTIKTGDAAAEVEVKTGLRNDAFSEILSGVQAGQTVVAPKAPVLGQ